MNVLFLDDEISRRKAFQARCPSAYLFSDAANAVNSLVDRVWDLVCLDHDLDDQFDTIGHFNTGMKVVEYICEWRPQIKEIIIHSLNVPAAEEMVRKLQDAGYQAQHIPFFWKQFDERMIHGHESERD